MAAALCSACSTASIAPKVASLRRAMIKLGIVRLNWQRKPGVESLLNRSLSQNLTELDIQLCRLTGVPEVFGRVAGWLFFNNRIIDADAPSHVSSNTSWRALANRAAQQKRAKYQHVIEDLRGSFTPLVCSTDAVLHIEYRAYQLGHPGVEVSGV